MTNDNKNQHKADLMNTVLDGLPDNLVLCGKPETAGRRPEKQENAFLRFLSSPVAAVAVSLCVAFAVLFGIIMAGRNAAREPVVSVTDGTTGTTGTTDTTDETGADETTAPVPDDAFRLIPSYELYVLPPVPGTGLDGATVVRDEFPVLLLPGEELLLSWTLENTAGTAAPDDVVLSIRPHGSTETWPEEALVTTPDGRLMLIIPADAAPGDYDLCASYTVGGESCEAVSERMLTVGEAGKHSIFCEVLGSGGVPEDLSVCRLFVKNTGDAMTTVFRVRAEDGGALSPGSVTVSRYVSGTTLLVNEGVLNGDCRSVRVPTGYYTVFDASFSGGDADVPARCDVRVRWGGAESVCKKLFYPFGNHYLPGKTRFWEQNVWADAVMAVRYTGKCTIGRYGDAGLLFDVVGTYRGETAPEGIIVSYYLPQSDVVYLGGYTEKDVPFIPGETYLLPLHLYPEATDKYRDTLGDRPGYSFAEMLPGGMIYMGPYALADELRADKDGLMVSPRLNLLLSGFSVTDTTTFDELGDYLARALPTHPID